MKELEICTFDYLPRLYERIRYVLRKFDINLIAKSPTKLKDLIQRKIKPIPNKQNCSVHSIPFKMEQNEFSYVGMTSKI